jgi:hypothetical protein
MRTLLFAALLLPASALAKDKSVITYKAPGGEDERPVATEIMVGPQGSDYAFRVDFDKLPWGDECKSRCANATLFLDTDNSTSTGLQLPDKKAAETGADLAITIQGVREYKESSADVLLRVKVRQFADSARSVEEGETLAELDHRRDPERLLVDGKTVYVLVDATNGTLPSGAKVRVVYHPPDSKPLVGQAKGLTAAGSGKVEIFKQGKRKQ